jgi:hypothetical protein
METKSASYETGSHKKIFLRFNMTHFRMLMLAGTSAVGLQGDLSKLPNFRLGYLITYFCPIFLGVKEKKTGIIKRKVPNNSYVVRTEVLEEDEEEDLGKPHFSPSTFQSCSLTV